MSGSIIFSEGKSENLAETVKNCKAMRDRAITVVDTKNRSHLDAAQPVQFPGERADKASIYDGRAF